MVRIVSDSYRSEISYVMFFGNLFLPFSFYLILYGDLPVRKRKKCSLFLSPTAGGINGKCEITFEIIIKFNFYV